MVANPMPAMFAFDALLQAEQQVDTRAAGSGSDGRLPHPPRGFAGPQLSCQLGCVREGQLTAAEGLCRNFARNKSQVCAFPPGLGMALRAMRSDQARSLASGSRPPILDPKGKDLFAFQDRRTGRATM